MIAILTGDIINSQSVETHIWNNALSSALLTFGAKPKYWDIFRGDSFQVRIDDIENAIKAAVTIKASIKSIKGLDLRISVGIGDIEDPNMLNITEANGSAFVRSGHLFDELKDKDQNLAISSPWPELDQNINMQCKLAGITMDKWLANAAKVMQYTLMNPDASQTEIGKAIGIAQNTVSERLSRSHKQEIMEFIEYCEQLIIEKIR